MQWKKALIAVPLSAAVLVPTAATGVVNSADAASKPSVDTPAANLRADLGSLLSEHANLAIITMRKGVEGEKDFDAASDQLSKNTDDLTKAISSAYGDKAGNQFKKMWSAHIGYFVDYVHGTADNKEKKKQKALDELSQYKDDFSKFLSNATDGNIEADALAQGLQEHVNQLITAFNAYANDNYQKAYNTQMKASKHMFMTGKGLSNAITKQKPDQFNNTMAVTPASDLRQQLNSLLSLHVSLAITAMQNGSKGDDAMDIFKANANALSKDTDQLSDAVASVYGDDAGKKFHKLWSDHIGYFVDYVKATANDDKDGKDKAMKNLKNYRHDFSQFIDGATDGKTPSDAVSKELQVHVNQLIKSFNAYNNGNYKKAYKYYDKGYNYANDISKALSNGIVMQMPDKFAGENMPSGMPKTGDGSLAHQSQLPEELALILAVLAIISAVGFYMYRRNQSTEAK